MHGSAVSDFQQDGLRQKGSEFPNAGAQLAHGLHEPSSSHHAEQNQPTPSRMDVDDQFAMIERMFGSNAPNVPASMVPDPLPVSLDDSVLRATPQREDIANQMSSQFSQVVSQSEPVTIPASKLMPEFEQASGTHQPQMIQPTSIEPPVGLGSAATPNEADKSVDSREGLLKPAAHPMDSSRMLIGLMSLAQQANTSHASGDSFNGIIPREILKRLLSALHFRDVSTVRHARRVASLAIGVGQSLGWEGPQLKALEVASLMHDIGKIGIPDNILFKPGKLSPDEVELMALHQKIAVDVLQVCGVAADVLQIVSQTDNHYNGAANGFERIGSEVHLGSRILAVVDAYDSLATDQVYRDGKPHDEVMSVLISAAGTQFDGNIVNVLQRWMEGSGMPFDRQTGEFNSGDRSPGPVNPAEALDASELGHILSHLYLLENLYDGFYILDSQLKCVLWNSGVEQLFGRPATDVLQQPWSTEILPHRDLGGRLLPGEELPLLHVLRERRGQTGEVQVQHADQSWVSVELQSVPLIDQRGTLHGVVQIFRDLKYEGRKRGNYRDLKLAASQDALTQIANRGELESQLSQMVTEFEASDGSRSLSAMFLDVDFFKKINDTHGHSVGDAVLVDLAKLLQMETYSGELVGRYGGEEFVVLCPDTELDQCKRKAERLRIAIADTALGGLDAGAVTSSIGVAEFELGETSESLLKRADKGLYQAKEGGRNKVVAIKSGEENRKSTDAAESPANDDEEDPFIYNSTFAACVAADMIVYKLGGFVNDNRAKLLEVTHSHATMQVGERGLLPFWGNNDSRRPIRIEIGFTDRNETDKGEISRAVPIQVKVKPVGWVRNVAVFQERAREAVKTLRSYFVGE